MIDLFESPIFHYLQSRNRLSHSIRLFVEPIVHPGLNFRRFLMLNRNLKRHLSESILHGTQALHRRKKEILADVCVNPGFLVTYPVRIELLIDAHKEGSNIISRFPQSIIQSGDDPIEPFLVFFRRQCLIIRTRPMVQSEELR